VHFAALAVIVIWRIMLGASIVLKGDGIGTPTKPARECWAPRMKREKFQKGWAPFVRHVFEFLH
jgi:hypothetical protein